MTELKAIANKVYNTLRSRLPQAKVELEESSYATFYVTVTVGDTPDIPRMIIIKIRVGEHTATRHSCHYIINRDGKGQGAYSFAEWEQCVNDVVEKVK